MRPVMTNISRSARKKLEGIDSAQILRYLVFCAAASGLVIYAWIVCSRIAYPYELEWIEGGVLEQVRRIVTGQEVYLPPSIDFIPFIYPPFYFNVSAVFARVFGIGFFPLRLVSVISSLITFGLIFEIVRKETHSGWAAFISTGLFAIAFRVTGAWLDVARVDSLFLALVLTVFLFTQKKPSTLNSILGGLFAGLALLTKQTALIILIPLILFLLWQNWRQAILFLFSACLLAGGTSLFMDIQSDGWYSFYIFESLSQQAQWLPLEFVTFWTDDLFLHLPIATLLAVLALISKEKKEINRLLLWLAVLAGALGASFLSRVKIGGYDNVLLPAYAVLAILFGIGLTTARTAILAGKEEGRKLGEILLQAACLLQLLILFYNPFAQIPSLEDRQEGERLVATIAASEGSVYIPDHGYLLSLAGREPVAHHAAIWDVMRTEQSHPAKVTLSEDLEEAIHLQRYDVIILDAGGNFCCPEIERYYTRVGEIIQDEEAFFPVTGDRRRPTYIYEAKR